MALDSRSPGDASPSVPAPASMGTRHRVHSPPRLRAPDRPMTANLVLAASAAGQGPDDIFMAIMAAVSFVVVGSTVLAYVALRRTSRR